MSTEALQLVKELNQNFEALKEANKQADSDREEHGRVLKDTADKIAKIDNEFEALREKQSELEREIALARVPRDRGASERLEEEAEHTRAFENWLRNPKDPEASTRLKHAAAAAVKALNGAAAEAYGTKSVELRRKAVTLSGSAGGIPTEIHDRIVSKIIDISPVRQVANVATTSNENRKFPVIEDDSGFGWAGAGDSRSETATPSIQGVTLTYGTAYGYPKIEEEALNDLAWDVLAWLEDDLAMRLARAEGIAFISGDGSSKPTGFTSGSPSAVADTGASPERAFGTLQYLPTGAAAGFQEDAFGGTSPETDPAACLFDALYALRAGYRQNAVWMMNRLTLAAVRKFRDADGNYLFLPGLVAGTPDRLLGYPLQEAEDMPDLGANAFPIAVGDFNRGYQIADIVGTMNITVDNNITAPGFVKFYGRRRLGGKVLDDDAIKLIKCATS